MGATLHFNNILLIINAFWKISVKKSSFQLNNPNLALLVIIPTRAMSSVHN